MPLKRKYELKKRAEEAAVILIVGRQARGRKRQLMKGALRHAVDFSTWRSLSTNGIGRSDATKLITELVEAAAGDGRGLGAKRD